MARWGSHCVLRYMKDVPMITITTEYKKRPNLAITDGNKDTKLGSINDQVQKQLQELQEEVIDVVSDFLSLLGCFTMAPRPRDFVHLLDNHLLLRLSWR